MDPGFEVDALDKTHNPSIHIQAVQDPPHGLSWHTIDSIKIGARFDGVAVLSGPQMM